MRTLKTDVAIIGAGTAGLNARREVERAGKRYLLIESGPLGTTCARNGCMPSKLLIAAADAARRARGAGLFGVRIHPDAIQIDGRAVLARVRRERDRFVELNANIVEELPRELVLRGRARFVAPTRLQVDDHTEVHATAVVIATGSAPIVPEQLAPIRDVLLTTDDVFELEQLPESLAVFGTGAIGLELGQAFHHLGVRVCFYNPFDALGSFTDPVIAARFRELLAGEFDLALGAQIREVRRDAEGILISHRDAAGEQHERRFSHVLAATGRKPAIADLELAAAQLEVDERGVPKFSRETTQCAAAAVFIAGDADGVRPLLHEAADEGRIAGANAASYPNVTRHERRVPLLIGFTSPEVAMVGETYEEVKRDVTTGEASYYDQGRARVVGENCGHVHVYARRDSKVVVGAELFGPAVEHTAHLLAWVIQQKLTVDEILRLPVYHPTLEEGIRAAFRDLARKLDVLGKCPPADRGGTSMD